MARDIQKQMDRFYEHYPIMDGLENTDTIDSFIIKKYKQYKDKEIISEEEYNAEIEKLKSSNSAENDLSFKEIIQEMIEEDTNKYPASLKAYKCIIDSTAQLCHELNLEDSMSIFAVFDYLLWNGYFSKDKNYIYTIGGRTNLMGHFGTDIINGQGVCLNKSYMLDNLLKAMNYESYIIVNKPSKKIIRDYKPNIERKVKKHGELPMKIGGFLFRPITNISGNHVCTLVKKDNVYYVYDPTNLCVFKLDKFLQAGIIGGIGSIDIKPYSLSLFSGLDNKKIVEIVESYKNVDGETKPYDISIIQSLFEENLELCQNNIALFNDFHIENESNRNKVLEIFKKSR